jgi:outer membrane protein
MNGLRMQGWRTAAGMLLVAGALWPATSVAQVTPDTSMPTMAGIQMPVPSDTLTMQQAVDQALRVLPQIVQAETSVQTARMSVTQQWASMLPSLSMSTGASVSGSQRFNPETNTVVTSPSSNSYNAGLSSSLTLFAGGRNIARLHAAQADATAADATLREQRYSVALSVKQAFFTVLRAQEQIAVGQANVKLAQENLDAATRRQQVGSGTISDVLQARVQVMNAQQSLLSTQSQKRTAMFALGRLVGVDGPVEARLEQPLEPRPLALSRDSLMSLAMLASPSVNAAVATKRARDASRTAARAAWFPSISASGGYTVVNDNPTLNNSANSWRISLGLSYPLFNGLQRESSIEQANAQAAVADAQLADARRSARSQLEALLSSLDVARQQVTLLRQTLSAAEEALRVQQERYRVGASTILDLITSQAARVQAEINLIGARYDYQIALAQLEALVGREL